MGSEARSKRQARTGPTACLSSCLEIAQENSGFVSGKYLFSALHNAIDGVTMPFEVRAE